MNALVSTLEPAQASAEARASDSRVLVPPGVRDVADAACRTACRTAGLRAALLVTREHPTGDLTVVGSDGAATPELLTIVGSASLSRVIDGADAHPGGRLLVVPLARDGRRAGFLVGLVDDPRRRGVEVPGRAGRPHRHGADDAAAALDSLDSLAEMLAAALAQARAAAAGEERFSRARVELARTIHEAVIQRLFCASLVLSAEAPLSRQEVEVCSGEVKGALRDLRAILDESLRGPTEPPARSLSATILELSDDPRVCVVCDRRPDDIAPDQQLVVQSILTEAIRNAHKHTTSGEITVHLDVGAQVVRLTVENDGATGTVAGEPGIGLRLAAIEAAHAYGLLEHGWLPNGRWRVRLTIPTRREPT